MSDLIKAQQEIARDIVSKFTHGEPILMGGAPRDWLIGRAATDLDIYVMNDKDDVMWNWIFMEALGITDYDLVADRTNVGRYNDVTIKFIYEAYHKDGQKCQLIVLDSNYVSSPWEYCKQFTASVSQVLWDGTEYHKTPLNKVMSEMGVNFFTRYWDEDYEYQRKIEGKFPSLLHVRPEVSDGDYITIGTAPEDVSVWEWNRKAFELTHLKNFKSNKEADEFIQLMFNLAGEERPDRPF